MALFFIDITIVHYIVLFPVFNFDFIVLVLLQSAVKHYIYIKQPLLTQQIMNISSTPFNVSVFIELPEEISQYIESKFTDISMTQVSSLAAFHLFRSNNKLTFSFLKVCLTRRTLSF